MIFQELLSSFWLGSTASVGCVGGFAPLLHSPTRRRFARLANCATKQVKQGVVDTGPAGGPELTGWVSEQRPALHWQQHQQQIHKKKLKTNIKNPCKAPTLKEASCRFILAHLFPESQSEGEVRPVLAAFVCSCVSITLILRFRVPAATVGETVVTWLRGTTDRSFQ